jgi:hypothetical protein
VNKPRKKRRKKKKDGKKRRAMWTEDEHRLFLEGYKLHPRNWTYLAKVVTSKTPTQIRTHAYSVFQRRRRVGTPLPSGFENMDHSWQQRRTGREDMHGRDDGSSGHEASATSECYSKQTSAISHDNSSKHYGSSSGTHHYHNGSINTHQQHYSIVTSSNDTCSPMKKMNKHLPQRDSEDPYEQLVMNAIRERATTWTRTTAMFPPVPSNSTRGSGTTLGDFFNQNIC